MSKIISAISKGRKARAQELDRIIATGFSEFVKVGNAIAEMHHEKLYRELDHNTFAGYMEKRHGWTRQQGYNQMRAARVAGLLMDGNVNRGLHPTHERQVRPLTLNTLTNEQIIEAWEEAAYLSNDGIANQANWRPPHERHVRYAVNEILSDRRRAKPRKLIELGKFNIIYCDPPWRYDYSSSNSRAIERFYDTMTMGDLFDMAGDVREISAQSALIFMWCPPAFTRKAILLMRVWGFDYRTNMVWVKPSIGAGQWVRQQHELLMLGMRGHFPTADGPLRPPSIVNDRRQEHSQKPKVFYELIEQMYPDSPKIELFARSKREGWEAWGDEVMQ